MNSPVAILIFNRPDLTQSLLNSLRIHRPEKIYVISDGARRGNTIEQRLVGECRGIIDSQVTWPCTVHKNYSEHNLGCGKRISSGLDWVFTNEEECIILEDDCHPVESFLPYASSMLSKFRGENTVMHIAGTNFMAGETQSRGAGYYFSRYSSIWGWATWRRAWAKYDFTMNEWRRDPNIERLGNLGLDRAESIYWKHCFDGVASGRIDSWDYQWAYACMMNRGISIVPNYNQVDNLGFRPDATHTPVTGAFTPRPAKEMIISSDALYMIEDIDRKLDMQQASQLYRLGMKTRFKNFVLAALRK